jgi:hypothetical protein
VRQWPLARRGFSSLTVELVALPVPEHTQLKASGGAGVQRWLIAAVTYRGEASIICSRNSPCKDKGCLPWSFACTGDVAQTAGGHTAHHHIVQRSGKTQRA